LAYHDGLTNLPNRRLAEEEIKAAMSQAELKNMKVGFMFIDLDNFKVVNDTLGHDIGDLLLIEAAERLKQSIRHKDIVSRLGGDEFMIVLKDISNSKQITDVAQRIIHTFATPFTIDKNIMKVTCSIGITVYPDEGEDVISLLKNADQAMYKVKQTGRNNYQFLNEYAS
jgi:diguanylate cyclase (GGDEF)-like protein